MASLHVRNVPEDLYNQLHQRAEAERRSLSAEVVILLQQAMAQPRAYNPAAYADLFQRNQALLAGTGFRSRDGALRAAIERQCVDSPPSVRAAAYQAPIAFPSM
ncbi:MAG TPA: Arc family DNA-binding protein [Chloroflexota bacterium]|nr:Arc family DNA-binding protein [Chloroflexota bacterium]